MKRKNDTKPQGDREEEEIKKPRRRPARGGKGTKFTKGKREQGVYEPGATDFLKSVFIRIKTRA